MSVHVEPVCPWCRGAVEDLRGVSPDEGGSLLVVGDCSVCGELVQLVEVRS